MIYVVYDLEATCWSDDSPFSEQEIIEIGAFKINRFGEVLDQFAAFVKPILHPNLSPFCQELTSITQAQVNRANTFDVVQESFVQWIEEGGEETVLCSWGALDIDMLIHDCELHHIETDWLYPNIDIKMQYNKLKRKRKPLGMQAALRKESIEFEGTPHRAIDDAYNLCRLFVRYIDEWVV